MQVQNWLSNEHVLLFMMRLFIAKIKFIKEMSGNQTYSRVDLDNQVFGIILSYYELVKTYTTYHPDSLKVDCC